MAEPVALRQKLHLDSIEVCRGIAATMVVTSHAAKVLAAEANFGASPFGTFFQFGRSGVDFFFVLSGFLISLLHWQDIDSPHRLKRYATRRLTRIYPSYWLVLLAIVPFDIFTHTLFDDYNRPFEVLKSLLLLPQLHTILDVTWSLRNELLFYALFGLMIFSRGIGFIVVGAWIALMAVWPFALPTPQNSWAQVLFFPMNFEFIAGVLAGWTIRRVTLTRPLPLLAGGAALFLALWAAENQLRFVHLPWDRFIFVCLAYGAAATLVIVGLSALEMQGRIRMPRPLITLGGASYLLYLVHVPALLVLGATERHVHLLRFVPAWLLASIFVVMTVVGAVVLHILVERPVLQFVRKITQPRIAAAPFDDSQPSPLPVQ